MHPLEGRTLMSAYTVTSVADSGPGTLRQAILDANANAGADTIDFALGGGPHTISLSSGTLGIRDSVTITGPGADLLTVRRDSGGDYGIFNINGGPDLIAHVTLDGMTITNGAGPSGGAVTNFGTTIIQNCVLRDNHTTFGGGAIVNTRSEYQFFPNFMSISNSVLRNNSAGLGGAILNEGVSVSVTNGSVLSNNSATTGGAIYSSIGQVGILDSTVIGNVASDKGGAIYGEFSAGIFAGYNSLITGNSAHSGGAIFGGFEAYVSIHEATFSGNTAAAEGGAVSTDGATSLVSNGATFTGNVANGAGGGAVAIRDTGEHLLLNTTFTANEAPAGAGGAVLVTAGGGTVWLSTLTQNAATNGGAVASTGGDALVLDSTLTANHASGDGGALYAADSGMITVKGSLVQQNNADGSGGALAAAGSGAASVVNSTLTANHADTSGGAVAGVAGASLSVRNATIVGNDAGVEGGGAWSDTAAAGAVSTIVAGNIAPLGADVAGSFADTGYNFIGTRDGDPMLGPLADNGGATLTMALLDGSPCINAGDPSFADTTEYDQRDFPYERLVGGRVDIGAFEYATPGQMALELSHAVNTLPLSESQRKALSSMIATHGDTISLGRLNAFLDRLNTYVADGTLTEEQVAPLLELADQILAALG
jgi:predicted outer membrane repeat protein